MGGKASNACNAWRPIWAWLEFYLTLILKEEPFKTDETVFLFLLFLSAILNDTFVLS